MTMENYSERAVDCLANDSMIETAQSTIEQRDIAVRFEALLDARPEQRLRIAELCSALDVSARTLRLSCEEQLGMRPTEYLRRQRKHQKDWT
jgi:AraC-like DNA-binding protein